jgi:hypothetical protein
MIRVSEWAKAREDYREDAKSPKSIGDTFASFARFAVQFGKWLM